MEREISVKELRTLPVGTKITIHGHDKYGYPTALPCELVLSRSGRAKELRYNGFDGFSRRQIRTGQSYTMEVDDDGHEDLDA